jgi:hypothetical protein
MARLNLTLQVDDETLSRAERSAAAAGKSVPEMLESFLKVLALPALEHGELPPVTRRLVGILPAMSDEEVERVLDEERERKHGRRP